MDRTSPAADDAPGILALAFDSPERAQDAALAVQQLADDGFATLDDIVMLSRHGHGPAHVTGRGDPVAPAAAVPSTLVGAVVGTLVAGPIGMLIGGVLAGGSGALASRLLTPHIPHDVIVRLGAHARPGETVVAARLRGLPAAFAEELRRFPGSRLLLAELPSGEHGQARRAL
jgi:uncharacterized membrane protein